MGGQNVDAQWRGNGEQRRNPRQRKIDAGVAAANTFLPFIAIPRNELDLRLPKALSFYFSISHLKLHAIILSGVSLFERGEKKKS